MGTRSRRRCLSPAACSRSWAPLSPIPSRRWPPGPRALEPGWRLRRRLRRDLDADAGGACRALAAAADAAAAAACASAARRRSAGSHSRLTVSSNACAS